MGREGELLNIVPKVYTAGLLAAGGEVQIFIWGGSTLKSKALPFCIPFLTGKAEVPLSGGASPYSPLQGAELTRLFFFFLQLLSIKFFSY